MFCVHCGAQNPEGTKFCQKCGAPMGAPAKAQGTVPPAYPKAGPVAGAPGAGALDMAQLRKKLPPVKYIVAAVVAVLVLVLVVNLMNNAASTINLNNYLTIETTGVDGYGKAKAVIDWDAVAAKYGKKIAFTKKAEEDYGALLSLTTPLDTLDTCVSVSFDKNSELSNGDTIAYTWTVDEDVEKYLKCKIKTKDDSYKVSNLEAIGSFDAFAGVSVKYDGTAPDGYAVFDYKGEELKGVDFDVDKKNGLNNGDVITVTVKADKIENCAQKFGKVPATTEKQYTVEGLDEYVASYADLPEDYAAKLQADAQDTVTAYFANSYADTSLHSDLSFVGYYYAMIKPDEEYAYPTNTLYFVFSSTISNTDNEFEPTTVYFPVGYANILKNKDGIKYEYRSEVKGHSDLGSGWSTSGYADGKKMYSDLVTSSVDQFTHEVSDGLKVFGE